MCLYSVAVSTGWAIAVDHAFNYFLATVLQTVPDEDLDIVCVYQYKH